MILIEAILILITLESVPGTNQYKAMTVKFFVQRHNRAITQFELTHDR